MSAGNLWEWTVEGAYYKDSTNTRNMDYNSYMLRGGGLETKFTDGPACFRSYNSAPKTHTRYGFRPALFL